IRFFFISFFLLCVTAFIRYLHSFPTRRSSDLVLGAGSTVLRCRFRTLLARRRAAPPPGEAGSRLYDWGTALTGEPAGDQPGVKDCHDIAHRRVRREPAREGRPEGPGGLPRGHAHRDRGGAAEPSRGRRDRRRGAYRPAR